MAQNLRAACAGLTGEIDDVLDRNRHTAKRKIDIGLVGLRRCRVEIKREIGIDAWLDLLDSRAQGVQNFARRHFAAPKQRLEIGDGERRQVGRAHSTTLVTMKSWFALW